MKQDQTICGVRGGSWDFPRVSARADYRYGYNPTYRDVGIGFRVLSGVGTARVLRGGSWYNFQVFARADARLDLRPDDRYVSLGFRVLE